MDTSGSPSLVMIVVQSASALALAAVVASPSGGAPVTGAAIAATRVAGTPAVMYGTVTDVCRGLDASPRPVALARLTAGTAVRVVRIAQARCHGFTVPMLEVRVAAAHGFIPAGDAAPLPLANEPG